ncbi:3-oxoacyl-ACP reductase [Sulfitobacter sp. EhC04]|uniref:SDR family NAD(P)-dependent oxidoreductase n=1 Tax=Sulfitobacter sp. EhC04 TaxID=1849168 RepID=UPI0007F4A4EA|nr:SDR family NAD(P)-dependent oxidoreductase [Sulfitobacter sp. EhC04]OAN75943.1 3-oxoacyl-ACP reductase [Sulfitobacter sp. EhC04]
MHDLTGKVAFVTGAGSVGEGWGNGKAAAVLMARQGALVFGVDISAEALESTAALLAREGIADRWHSVVCDMTVDTQVESSVLECQRHFGQIDILVNNIGGSAPGDPVSMSEEVWHQQLDLNLTTAFLACKHVLPIMEQQFEATAHGGSIVNIGSIGSMSFQVGGRVSAGYAASKAGLEAFSRSTAIAYVLKGIRVNTVVPGVMYTPLVEHRLVGQLGAADAERLIAERHASVPMGRMGDAWDVAHAVLFLASDEAGYITATQIVVDGGMTAARPS